MPLRPFAFWLICLLGLPWSPSFAAAAERAPAIPLPDVPPDSIAHRSWPRDRPLSNSARAWHYIPKLVQPLADVGDAVDQGPLTGRLKWMLITVVASRNECRY
jgi:hypothetical protein